MQAIILAGGKGTRMQSAMPKVLHQIGGRTLIDHVLDHLHRLGVTSPIVVVGHAKETVMAAAQRALPTVRFVLQEEPRGTADAVRMALPLLDAKASTFIVMGDNPFFSPTTFAELSNAHRKAQAVISMVTAIFPDPLAYGRIIRTESGEVERIVELKDAKPHERAVKEINAGCYLADSAWLAEAIPRVAPSPVTDEYYLTDLIHIAVALRKPVGSYRLVDYREALGVNSPAELASAEAAWQAMRNTAEEA